MRIISDKSLHRPGCITEAGPGGGFIEYPAGIEPYMLIRLTHTNAEAY